MSKTRVLAVAAVAIVAAGGWWMMQAPAGPGQTAFTAPSVAAPANAQEANAASEAARVPDMVLGEASAPVEVIEYASFTCPHCANFHATVFGKLKADYIETGKVRFVYREVYFDKFGLWAGMVARCGGAEKYFPIAEILYETQRDWLAPGDDAGIAANLRKIGLKAGIAGEALDACFADNDMAKAMVATYQANAGADGINSTPSFIIDGQKYSNMAYEDFAKAIEEKLAD